jgi:serine O-acetyltransferase
MKMELSMRELEIHVNRQLTNMFGPCGDLLPYLHVTLERVEKCFKVTQNKYYKNWEGGYFSPYHSGQYAIFLYCLANTIHRASGDVSLATKIYYLNKIMHSVDWYYEIELPEYWGVEHPLGSVLGRAKYGKGFFIYQGCTVGGNKEIYPELGKNVILYANATVLGGSKIGNNVVISTGATVKDESIPDCCLVFGQSPNLIIKRKDAAYMDELISKFWSR